jgi:hypothetical protein
VVSERFWNVAIATLSSDARKHLYIRDLEGHHAPQTFDPAKVEVFDLSQFAAH